MPSSAGTLRSVSVLTHLSGGDPAGLVGVSLTICQMGRLGRKKEEGTTLIPILPFVVLGNHWSPGKVTWANPRLGKVTLNRARLHLSPEYRARLSVTLPNLGFAQVTYPGDLMVPEHNEGSMGISVLPLLSFLPNPPTSQGG